MSGEKVADAFSKLAQVADQSGIDCCAVSLEYVQADDELLPGDLIPTITFSLERRRTIDPKDIEIRRMDPDTIEVPNPLHP